MPPFPSNCSCCSCCNNLSWKTTYGKTFWVWIVIRERGSSKIPEQYKRTTVIGSPLKVLRHVWRLGVPSLSKCTFSSPFSSGWLLSCTPREMPELMVRNLLSADKRMWGSYSGHSEFEWGPCRKLSLGLWGVLRGRGKEMRPAAWGGLQRELDFGLFFSGELLMALRVKQSTSGSARNLPPPEIIDEWAELNFFVFWEVQLPLHISHGSKCKVKWKVDIWSNLDFLVSLISHF